MRGKIFADKHIPACANLGITADNCSGIAWLKEKTDANPDTTFRDLVDDVEARIAAGTADDGWFLSALSVSWDDMLEDERIMCIRALAKRGAHKTLLGPSFTNHKLTQTEFDVLEDELRAKRHVPAADRLVRVKDTRLKVVEGSNG